MNEEDVAVRAFRPGIYSDVPFDEYRRISAINASTLAWAEESAAHLKAALDGKMDHGDSPALAYGRAFHARILEPELYWKHWTIAGTCQALLKSGVRKDLACGADGKFYDPDKQLWYCGTHVPKLKELGGALLEPMENLLQPETAKRIEHAARRVEDHPVMKLIRQRGGFEVSVLGVIDDMGLDNYPLKVKARFDKLVPPTGQWSQSTIIDLKKVQVGKANDEDVSWALDRWNYCGKAAFYLDLFARVTGQQARWIFIFVEDDYPFAINVCELDSESIQIGRMQYTDWLGKYVVGMTTNSWPSHSVGTQVRRAGLPEVIKRKYLGRS